MKILLFGGTFDPPHRGHMALLHCAIDAVQPDLTLILPAGVPPHKAAAHSSPAVRLAMCRTLCRCGENIKIDPMETRRGGKSYTVLTLRTLRRRYPGAQLYFCMGSDMLLFFRQWYRWQEILRLCTLVVHSRQDGDDKQLRQFADGLAADGAHIVFAPGTVLEMSSTQVRTAVQTGQSLTRLVPPQVARIIRKKHLYRTEAEQGKG